MKMIYDFRNGKMADHLGLSIKKESDLELARTEFYGWDSRKMEVRNGLFFLKREGIGRELLFYYLKDFNSESHKYQDLPKFHVMECKSMKERGSKDYTYKVAMPVNVYCNYRKKTLREQHLELCNECRKEVKRKFQMNRYGVDNWEDLLLSLTSSPEVSETRSDGYPLNWEQISRAYRETVEYKCEGCGLDLKENLGFLDVHHKKSKRRNRPKHLVALCMDCHRRVDRHHWDMIAKKDPERLRKFYFHFPQKRPDEEEQPVKAR